MKNNRKRKYILCGILLLGLASGSVFYFFCRPPAESPYFEDDLERATYILMHTKTLTTSHVGYSAIPVPTAWAFTVLVNDAKVNGPAKLIELYETTRHRAARLYALTGLYWTHKSEYDKLIRNARLGSIDTQIGCVHAAQPAEELIERYTTSDDSFNWLVMDPLPDYAEIADNPNVRRFGFWSKPLPMTKD